MAAKKNFYTVVAGRKPGIYTQWGGPGGAEEQVKGFAGAVFQGFATRAEAEAFLRSGGKRIEPAPELPLPGLPARSTAGAAPAAARSTPEYSADLAAGKVVVFTDGASTGNPGPGGYGAVLLTAGPHTGEIMRSELSAGFRRTTNNRMELLGCIAALQSLKRRSNVVLYSDSRYVVNAVTLGWARRWQANGWLRAPNQSGLRQRAENVDLWEQMLVLLDQHDVEFRWVKGHANHAENERCDRLAVQAAHQPNLPPDPGFP
jgi:ribonuclease HI